MPSTEAPSARRTAILLLAAALVVTACGAADEPPGTASATPSPALPASASPLESAAASDEPTPTTAAPSASPSGDSERVPPDITLVPLASGLDAPVDVATRPGDPDALFVVEQVGRIRVVRDGDLADEPVLDIASQVSAGGERGLLGLAFHPDPSDPRLFTYYTDRDGDQVVASFEMAPDGDVASGDSERILLRMDDPFGNHNGGALAFGPDGYLYISTGDGGGGGDPLDSGRRLDTLLAKILRIDIDAGEEAYGVPADNPFVTTAEALPEIWHTGLRNPWRMRFDRVTGDLWIGDVGQGAYEEIDRAPAGVGGLDFGWNAMEGFHCYDAPDDSGCDDPGFTLPIAEYGHDEGCSVTGGSVYRGRAIPALTGWYLFSDYCSGRIWAVDADAADPMARQEPLVLMDSERNISAIGEDAAGELILTDISTGDVLMVASPAT